MLVGEEFDEGVVYSLSGFIIRGHPKDGAKGIEDGVYGRRCET